MMMILLSNIHSKKDSERAPAAELFYFSAFLENLWRSLRKM
jgi:hypothetical protein